MEIQGFNVKVFFPCDPLRGISKKEQKKIVDEIINNSQLNPIIDPNIYLIQLKKILN